MRITILAAALLMAVPTARAQIVIDHTCTDLDAIPDPWIEAVKQMDSHYAHTSHGGQLTYGMQFIETADPFYNIAVGSCYLPSVAGAYCVFDGQQGVSYITPDLYWESGTGMDLTRAVLDANPSIISSMWSWCCQCDSYSAAQVQAYLDSMSVLESEYPGVTFVYFTGNAQATGSSGYNRWQRNQQIRSYCLSNDKVLFDFADLDCWWFNPSSQQWEQHTYTYGSYTVPSEHPHFYGDQYGHTTAESCTQKGRAWWWMMAVLAGWGGTGVEGGGAGGVEAPTLALSPNPCHGTVCASFEVPPGTGATLHVYDLSGREVIQPVQLGAGEGQVGLDLSDPGVRLVRIESGAACTTGRVVVLP